MALKKIAAVSAAACAALLTAALVTPAHAEPVAGLYAVVGSDTLEDATSAVFNGVSGTIYPNVGTDVRSTTNKGNTVGSFDATGSVWIQTKAGGPRIPRPDGSGSGRGALYSSFTQGASFKNAALANGVTTVFGQVDLIRNSGNPNFKSSGTVNTAWYPFGRDALGLAFNNSFNSTVISAGLTIQNLKDIYNCSATTINGVSYPAGSFIPMLPQSGSGTRSSMLSLLAMSEGTTLQSKYKSNGGCIYFVQEHDPSYLTASVDFYNTTITTTTDGTNTGLNNRIMPMSASRWIAMKNGVSTDKTSTAIFSAIDNTDGSSNVAFDTDNTVTAPSGSPRLVPNATYYYANNTWGRDCWIGVQKDRVTSGNGSYDAELASVLKLNDPFSIAYVPVDNNDENGTTFGIKKMFGFLKNFGSNVVNYGNITSATGGQDAAN